jgi:hypothetical protein
MDTWNTGARTSDFSANGGSVEFSLAYSINKAGKELEQNRWLEMRLT